MILSVVLLAMVTAQRLGELIYAEFNTRRLKAKGAFEVASGHYPLIVALHVVWLAGLWLLAWNRPLNLPVAGLFLFVEVMRVWTLASLGSRWTTRIIVLPGAPLVRRGPYRFFPHPNYAVVAAEIAVLPAAFGLWVYAAVFTVLNALVLWVRIRAENRALSLPFLAREGPQSGPGGGV